MQLTVAESSYFTGCSLLLQNAAVLQGAADCYRVQLYYRVQLLQSAAVLQCAADCYRVQLTVSQSAAVLQGAAITESSCVTVCS